MPLILQLSSNVVTCLVTFGERLNSFSADEQDESSRSSKLMWAAETTNSNILPTDQGLGVWRHFETGSYKKLRKSQEYMESVAVDLVSQKLAFFKDTSDESTESPCSLSRTSLVEQYLKNPNLDLCDVVGMAADLLLAGVDTTSYTSAFALYHISRHPQIQQRLYEESLRVLPDKQSPLLADCLNTGIPLTRATLKEVFRLNPISVGVGRILTKDMLLSGYQVPKGVRVNFLRYLSKSLLIKDLFCIYRPLLLPKIWWLVVWRTISRMLPNSIPIDGLEMPGVLLILIWCFLLVMA